MPPSVNGKRKGKRACAPYCLRLDGAAFRGLRLRPSNRSKDHMLRRKAHGYAAGIFHHAALEGEVTAYGMRIA